MKSLSKKVKLNVAYNIRHSYASSADISVCLFSELTEHFYYQLMHITLKNAELLKHSKLEKTLQHVSVYIETIFRELKSVLG